MNDRPTAGSGGASTAQLKLGLYGVDELEVAGAAAAELGDGQPSIGVAIHQEFGEVELTLTFPEEAAAGAAAAIARLRERFAGDVYSTGEPIEAVVVRELAARGETLAVAESCTGGLVAAAVTSVSGSSDVFRGGVVAYHNDVKVGLLGVREEILENAGAVSEPVAQWMAVGARNRLGADYGIGITGIAGPTGATADKPVGLVYISVSSAAGDVVR
ncbi:MAG: nicotinamide-nucleotide amidohydrolase family protein, partial [Thermoleophilia bacterium]